MSSFKTEYNTLTDRIRRLRTQREELTLREQARCDHPNIWESVDSKFNRFRVCTRCGYAEEGGDTGYWGLRGRLLQVIAHVGLDEAKRKVLKLYRQPNFPDHARNRARKLLEDGGYNYARTNRIVDGKES